MGYVSTRMGDCFGALLVSLMALRLALVDPNLFQPCCGYKMLMACLVNPAHANAHPKFIFFSTMANFYFLWDELTIFISCSNINVGA